MKNLIPCFLVLLLSVHNSSYAETFRVAAYPWAPFIDQDRKDGGIAIEVIRQALATQGHSIEVVNLPWVRALSMIKSNKIDIIPAAWHTQERSQFMQYSQYYAKNRLVFIKSKTDNYEFEGLDSLNGKVVAIVRDYAYGEDFLNNQNIEFSIANSLESNVKKVIARRAALTIADEIVAKSVIPPETLKQIRFTNNALSENTLHMTCSKTNPKCDDIIKDFNVGLKKIKTDGTLDLIINSLENTVE